MANTLFWAKSVNAAGGEAMIDINPLDVKGDGTNISLVDGDACIVADESVEAAFSVYVAKNAGNPPEGLVSVAPATNPGNWTWEALEVAVRAVPSSLLAPDGIVYDYVGYAYPYAPGGYIVVGPPAAVNPTPTLVATMDTGNLANATLGVDEEAGIVLILGSHDGSYYNRPVIRYWLDDQVTALVNPSGTGDFPFGLHSPIPMHQASKKFYVGGKGDGATPADANQFLCYDSNTDTIISSLAQLPFPAYTAGHAINGDTVYVIGGNTTKVQAYDILTDTWSQLPELPVSTRPIACGVVFGELWVFVSVSGVGHRYSLDLANPVAWSDMTTVELNPFTSDATQYAYGMVRPDGWSFFMLTNPDGATVGKLAVRDVNNFTVHDIPATTTRYGPIHVGPTGRLVAIGGGNYYKESDKVYAVETKPPVKITKLVA